MAGASMPSSSPAVPVEILREAVRKRVEESSLRVAAGEIGMSWKGLDRFVKGSTEPYPSTIRKLTDWYLRRAASEDEAPDTETAQAALAVLVRYLPPAHRDEAVARVVAVLQNLGEERGVPAPGWVAPERMD